MWETGTHNKKRDNKYIRFLAIHITCDDASITRNGNTKVYLFLKDRFLIAAKLVIKSARLKRLKNTE